MKKYLYTIILMSISVIGFMYFSKPVKALIYNDVDYRILETGTPIEIDSQQYNPIVINADYGGVNLSHWLYYMQVNNLHRVEMTGPNVSTFYLYYGTTPQQLSNDVFKMELGYDTGFAYFYMRLYGLNQVMIEEVVFANTQNQWELPSDTRVLTNINFQNTDDVYSKGYDNGYDHGLDDGYDNGLDDGYDDGYDTAKNDYGYDDNGNIISGQNAYDKGYFEATQDAENLKTEIINFVPGVLGSIFMFFFQVGQIGILGITILDILGILVLISGLIFVIKLFF